MSLIGTPERQQRGECQRLGVGPVDAPVRPGGLAALLQERLELAVHREAVRHLHDLLVERAQQVLGQRGLGLAAHRHVDLVLARGRRPGHRLLELLVGLGHGVQASSASLSASSAATTPSSTSRSA